MLSHTLSSDMFCNRGSCITFNEIGLFLNPYGDLIAMTFLFVMLVFSVIVIILVLVNANENSWINNWQLHNFTENPSNNSAEEISESVATTSEKIAEMLPSLLLVMGLLATFLGLGITINKASTMLATPTSDTTEMMKQLMGMMEGLGAKFKTSTYGIIGFIVLNFLFLGKKSKRLAWVIEQLQAIEDEKQTIAIMEQEKQKEVLTTHHQQLIKSLENIFKEMQISNQENLDEIRKIANYNQKTQQAMQDFVDNNVKNMQAIGESADKMSIASGNISNSAQELEGVIKKLKTDLNDVILKMEQAIHDMDDTVKGMGEGFKAQMTGMAKTMSNATDSMDKTVQKLSEAIDDTMQDVTGKISQSMDIQTKSAESFELIGDAINTNIVAMTGLVESLSISIQDDLTATLSTNNRLTNSMNKNIEKMAVANKQFIDVIKDTLDMADNEQARDE